MKLEEMDLETHPRVYPPDDDTRMLLHLADTLPEHLRILEVGVGGGAILLGLSRTSPALLVGTDRNPYAVALARSNSGQEVILTDLASCLKGPFDLVVFNAPYLPSLPPGSIGDQLLNLAWDGGTKGFETAHRLTQDLNRLLASDGKAWILLSMEGGASEFIEQVRTDWKTDIISRESMPDGEVLVVVELQRD